MNPIEALAARLGAGTDAAMLISEENRLYFTGFAASDGCLLVSRKGSVFFTDGRYSEAAAKTVTRCEVRESRDFAADAEKVFAQWGATLVAVETEHLTLERMERLRKSMSEIEFITDGALDREISSLRAVKTDEELRQIEAAQRIAEDAFDHILNYISVGKTEREIALELDYYMLRHGAEALSFETIAVSGINSSLPHGVPSQKPLARGDFLTLDYGAVLGGYHSDMTRTIALGEVSGEQKEIYDLVLRAQEACLSSLRPGLSCVEADAQARTIIADSGYGSNFSHGTGHGVGIAIHESPNLSPRSQATLAVGNVVTVEPGIYLPGRFGVRIEDMALITPGGHRNLTRTTKELIVLK